MSRSGAASRWYVALRFDDGTRTQGRSIGVGFSVKVSLRLEFGRAYSKTLFGSCSAKPTTRNKQKSVARFGGRASATSTSRSTSTMDKTFF